MIIWENAVGRLLLFTFSDLKLHLFPQITTKQHYRDETERLSTLNCLKRLSFLEFFCGQGWFKTAETGNQRLPGIGAANLQT